MRAAIFVVLLLSAVCIGSSDAKWLKRAWQSVKQAVSDAIDWIEEHCTVTDGVIRCNLGRRRREVLDEPDQATLQSKNELCDKILEDSIILQQGFTFDLIKDVFEAVDRGHGGGNGDDILDEDEYNKFMETLELFQYCFSMAK